MAQVLFSGNNCPCSALWFIREINISSSDIVRAASIFSRSSGVHFFPVLRLIYNSLTAFASSLQPFKFLLIFISFYLIKAAGHLFLYLLIKGIVDPSSSNLIVFSTCHSLQTKFSSNKFNILSALISDIKDYYCSQTFQLFNFHPPKL